jgi:hypothetical protein
MRHAVVRGLIDPGPLTVGTMAGADGGAAKCTPPDDLTPDAW